jgi:hypothetical protein
LFVTVTPANPGWPHDAVAGFALTVRCGPSPAAPPDHREVTRRNRTRP